MLKKIASFALALIAFSSVFAQMNAVIYSEGGEKFTLYLNGEAMSSSPQSNLKLQNLTSEFYQARIDFQDAALADFSNNSFGLHQGMEVTYQIKKNKKGEYVLRFYTENPVFSASKTKATEDNNVLKDFAVADDAPANSPSNQPNNSAANSANIKSNAAISTNSNPNNSGNVGMSINVDGVSMGMNINVDETDNGNSGNIGMSINVDGMNMGINMKVPNTDTQITESGSTTTTTTTRTTTSASSTNSNVPSHTTRPSEPANNQPSNQTIVGNSNCIRSMDSANFNKAKQTIESKGFDDTRLSTAKQVAKANCLTTTQILEIMHVFGFEDSRLEFAKYAYDYCFDQNNYYNVSQGFSFDSSTEELNSYLESK